MKLSHPEEEEEKSNNDVRMDLTNIYQSYSELYPNPRLPEEYLERDRLLHQVAEEIRAQQQQQQLQQQPTPKRGFFASLFGSSKPQSRHDPVVVDDKTHLVYSEIEDNNSNTTDSLCGTSSVLEVGCIPQEAHSVARFHLASTTKSRFVVVRNSISPMIILRLGVVAELVEDQWTQTTTSDRDDLEEYVSEQNDFHTSHTRACMVGPNLLAVSWGLSDGIVVLYRRMMGFGEVGWESVAMLGSTQAVLENVQSDVFCQNADGSFSSPRLRVTDLIPLIVDMEESAAATLVIARMGGYMELVPLSLRIWYGPVLNPKNHKITRRRRKAPRRRSNQDTPAAHYALGHLYNVVSDERGIAALTTCEHHDDLLRMECFRTTVGTDTKWDNETFPHSPPAEFVLVATGTKTTPPTAGKTKTADEGEVVTFWAVSTIFSEEVTDAFSLHVSYLDAVSLGPLGCNVTVFANDAIASNWRKPRRVQLRRDVVDAPRTSSRPATLSVAAPIRSMSFQQKGTSVFLAILDCNGGVTVLDSSAAVRMAAQTVKGGEKRTDDKAPLNTLLLSRTQIAKESRKAGRILDVEWADVDQLILLQPNRSLTTLALNSNQQKTLQRATTTCLPRGLDNIRIVRSPSDKSISLIGVDHISTALTAIGLEGLSPMTMIRRLAEASKFKEAIAAAEGLNNEGVPTEIVINCHKRLWQQNRQLSHLRAVPDPLYVVGQTVNLMEINDEQQPACDLESARQACHLALECLDGMSVASVLKLEEDLETLKSKIENWKRRAGTYVLLCRRHGVEPTLRSFHKAFKSTNLLVVALSMATKGDIASLTILLFRHRQELIESLLDILARIPLAISPSSYGHLLPTFSPSDDGINYFVLPNEEKGSRQWSFMNTYYQQAAKQPLLLDNESDSMAMVTPSKDKSVGEQQASLAQWFLARAQRLERGLGNIQVLMSFCDIAMRCLASSSRSMPSEPSLRRLHAMRLCADFLDKMYSKSTPTYGHGDLPTSYDVEVSVSDIQEKPMSEVITLILGPPDDPMETVSKFRGYVIPFLTMPGVWSGPDDGRQMNDVIDDAIVSYCTKIIRTHEEEEKVDVDQERTVRFRRVKRLRASMSVCAAIATASRSSIAKQQRMIKGRQPLMELVLSLANDVSVASKSVEMLPTDTRRLVDQLWETYECLPVRLPQSEEADKTLSELSKKVDHLYRMLAAVDILSRWCPDSALSKLSSLLAREVDEDRGPTLVSAMCKGFCKQTGLAREASLEEKRRLTQDLLSDINQLNVVSFKSVLDVKPTIHESLVDPLLAAKEFGVLADILQSKDSILDREQVKDAVLAFVTDAMFDKSGEKGHSIEAAIACQDALGSRFPELQESFSEMRQYLDAAHFINHVLCNGQPKFQPSQLRTTLPFDVIESLLADVPDVMLEGVSEWKNKDFARRMNAIVVAHHIHPGETDRTDLPNLPGGAVFHLAAMLGLRDARIQLAIASRMVHHSLLAELPWVAGCLALSIVTEEGAAWDAVDAPLRLRVSAAAVAVEEYEDDFVKSTLCNQCFLRCKSIELHGGDALSVLLGAHAKYEQRHSRFEPKNWQQTGTEEANGDQGQSGSDFLVFRAAGLLAGSDKLSTASRGSSGRKVLTPRPIDRVYHQTSASYSTNIHDLFSILRTKSARAELDNPLLFSLSRLIVFWCISEGVLITPINLIGSFEAADAEQVLALGASLLLHATDKDGIAFNLKELRQIVEAQSSTALEELASRTQPSVARPDLEMVRQLVTRGFKENGARRAVVMTGNESTEIALQWAVLHASDPGFDDPIVVLRSPTDGYMDQSSIKNIRNALTFTTQYIEGSRTLQSFVPRVEISGRIGPAPRQSQQAGQAASNEQTSKDQKIGKATANTRSLEVNLAAPTQTKSSLQKTSRAVGKPLHASGTTHTASQGGQARSGGSSSVTDRTLSDPTSVPVPPKQSIQNSVGSPEPDRSSSTDAAPASEQPSPSNLALSEPTEGALKDKSSVRSIPTQNTELPEAKEKTEASPAVLSSRLDVSAASLRTSKAKPSPSPQSKAKRLNVPAPPVVAKPIPSPASKPKKLNVPARPIGGGQQPTQARSSVDKSLGVLTPSRSGVPSGPSSTSLKTPDVSRMNVSSAPKSLDVATKDKPNTTPVRGTPRTPNGPPPSSLATPPPIKHTSAVKSTEERRTVVPSAPRSAPSSLDRSMLKKQGELARTQIRATTSQLDRAERQRLISKGRRLLQRARTAKEDSSSKPAAAEPAKPRPPPPPPTPPKEPRATPPPRPPTTTPRQEQKPVAKRLMMTTTTPSPRPPPPTPPKISAARLSTVTTPKPALSVKGVRKSPAQVLLTKPKPKPTPPPPKPPPTPDDSVDDGWDFDDF